jgi:hypothetical protein
LTLSNPVLKAPAALAIETIYDDELLSNVAFKINLRCYKLAFHILSLYVDDDIVPPADLR